MANNWLSKAGNLFVKPREGLDALVAKVRQAETITAPIRQPLRANLEGIKARLGLGEQELASPLPKPIPTPTPDPFIAKGWVKTGENRYGWPTPTPTPAPKSNFVLPSVAIKTTNRWVNTISKYFPPEVIPIVRRLIHNESSGNDKAVNVNKDGSEDIGLTQINWKVWGKEIQKEFDYTKKDLFDPEKNLAVARWIYDKRGWQDWVGVRGFMENIQ